MAIGAIDLAVAPIGGSRWLCDVRYPPAGDGHHDAPFYYIR
ncbi:MAG: hypothetical protein JWN52_258 [Actinomycetia bacterium]|nr:hypothetical protein [Actinomycetes bacterium]